MSGHPSYAGSVCVAQIAAIGHVGSAQFVNTQHFRFPGVSTSGPGLTACAALAADWDTNIRPTFLAAKPADFVLDTIRASLVAVPGLAHAVFTSIDQTPTTTVGSLAGGASGDYSSAVVLRFRTALGGKHYRGRNFIGPFPQTNQWLNGVLGAAASITALNNYKTALLRYVGAGAYAATAEMVVWSRPAHAGERQWTKRVGGVLTVFSNPAAEAGTATAVTTLAYDLTGRSQRRREVGVGA